MSQSFRIDLNMVTTHQHQMQQLTEHQTQIPHLNLVPEAARCIIESLCYIEEGTKILIEVVKQMVHRGPDLFLVWIGIGNVSFHLYAYVGGTSTRYNLCFSNGGSNCGLKCLGSLYNPHTI